MIRSLLVCITLFAALIVTAQTFNGQWKGHFQDIATGRPEICDYSLELTISGSTVTGHSFTYFSENNQRYYTICKITGIWQSSKNELMIQETELVKTNLPNHIQNCFQRHTLIYSHESGNDVLKGKWLPAQKNSDCGFGSTYLSRNTLQRAFHHQQSPITAKRNQATTNQGALATGKIGRTAIAQTNTLPRSTSNRTKTKSTTIASNNTASTKTTANGDATGAGTAQYSANPAATSTTIKRTDAAPYPATVTQRKSNLISVYDIENSQIVIELYDNGEIDGDSITLFFNKQIILSKKQLSASPFKFELDMTAEAESELLMYAENLGSEPPNTAFMVIKDGKIRHQTRITSDLEKSGVIRFRYNRKTP
jgi:hypothetical protein